MFAEQVAEWDNAINYRDIPIRENIYFDIFQGNTILNTVYELLGQKCIRNQKWGTLVVVENWDSS